MKLNHATSYAIQALIHMARDPDKQYTSHEVTRAEGIPEGFLLKILKPLVNARILLSLRGPNGGYRLARPAKGISVLEIMEAVEGPIHGQADSGPLDGKDKALARLAEVLDDTAEETRRRLGRVSIAELAGKGK